MNRPTVDAFASYHYGSSVGCAGWVTLPIFYVLICIAAQLNAEPPRVDVQSRNGQSWSGYVDEQTDHRFLWLRSEGQRVAVLRKFAWSDLTQVRVNGIDQSVSELQERLPQLRTSPKLWAWQSAAWPVPSTHQPTQPTPRIEDVRLSVELANWGSGEEPDRLLLELVPQNGDGESIPFTGHVSAKLYAPVGHSFIAVPEGSGVVWEPVAKWDLFVTAHEFRGNRYVISLPLHHLTVSSSRIVGDFGFLRVRLVIPGQRVLERRVEWVPVRVFRLAP